MYVRGSKKANCRLTRVNSEEFNTRIINNSMGSVILSRHGEAPWGLNNEEIYHPKVYQETKKRILAALRQMESRRKRLLGKG